MICGGIILGLLIIEHDLKESEFMLSFSCISFPRRKVIILSVLLFPLIITDHMPFRIADVCSSFSWRFVNIFTGISIFPHIFSYI